MVTEGSPFSIRCRVTREIPAASAAATALTQVLAARADALTERLELGGQDIRLIGRGQGGHSAISFYTKQPKCTE